ncbi:Hsp70 family protein [Pseudochrobactrum sp. MP213Fo]|uniref:Hsp70 family protein n=1 Tax=Pseudochrobactrum sp. MP213Fo TaxID=3022250 RepID=UPI003B9DDEC2
MTSGIHTPSEKITIGLDFGTTNTVIAVADSNGIAEVLSFPKDDSIISAYRSVLCFWRDGAKGQRHVESGPWAMDRFIDDPHNCRFLQSFKSFAASKSFTDTPVYGQRFKFEDLLRTFLESLAQRLGDRLLAKGNKVIVGRPVTFAGYNPDEALAMARYEKALRDFGFTDIHYVYEPVAAAFFYAQELKSASTVLVADFGGGTSDFSIVNFDVTQNGLTSTPLSQVGLGIAGDTLDYRIIDNVVSPKLGKRDNYKSFGKLLPIPNHYYASFARWNTLFLMNSPSTLRELHELASQAVNPDALNHFIEMIEGDYGFELYRVVSNLKVSLSSAQSAKLNFKADSFQIEANVHRSEFENWINEDMQAISDCVDKAVETAGIAFKDIDRVFLTGGTSFVPAIKTLFSERFEHADVSSSNQFDSIATGLALIGHNTDIERWSVKF